jgi:hypothetical protein
MSEVQKIAVLKEMIESAEASLRQAKKTLGELTGESFKGTSFVVRQNSESGSGEEGKVVEGSFDGERMVGNDGSDFPVPANYASKSKLIPGDVLKLTILEDGRFVYKQIGPVPRKQVVGTLVNENGKFKVLAEGNSYKVLLASVTYFRGEVGDRVSLVIPDGVESDWGAIEAVLPPDSGELDVSDHEHDEEGDEESGDYVV